MRRGISRWKSAGRDHGPRRPKLPRNGIAGTPIEITRPGNDGYVVVDAVQVIPVR